VTTRVNVSVNRASQDERVTAALQGFTATQNASVRLLCYLLIIHSQRCRQHDLLIHWIINKIVDMNFIEVLERNV